MRASFIFSSRTDESKNELYELSFITYFVCNILRDEKLLCEEIIEKLEKRIGCKVNRTKFKQFLSLNFYESYDGFSLKGYQIEALNNLDKFKKVSFFNLAFGDDDEDTFFSKICEFVGPNHFDISRSLPYSLMLGKFTNFGNVDVVFSLYFDTIINLDQILNRIDSAIVNIDQDYLNLSLKTIIENKLVLDLMFANGLFVIGDLGSVSVESLLTMIVIDYDCCISSFEQLNEENKLTFKDKIKNAFDNELLTQREKQVISKRNGFGCEKETLEEIGQKYNLTRERCRQIESSATLKISSNANKIRIQIVMLFTILASSTDNKYVSLDKIIDYLGDELLAKYYSFIVKNNSFALDLNYDEKLNVVYNSSLTSIEELSQNVVDTYGIYIFKSDFDKLNKFEQSVVQANYREYYPNLYLLKGYSSRDLFGLVIDESFPNGYRVYNKDDIKLVNIKFNEKFDVDETTLGQCIHGYIEKLDYCQINKGTYKNRQQCLQLPQDLIDSIINYLLSNAPTVYYQSIYEQFKSQLCEIGIDNYYYLKGLIDNSLPKDFKTKRNYIIVGNDMITGNESMIQFVKSFDDVFSINDLREKYPGVKDYTFYNVLAGEIDNGLIWLADKKFIYADKVIIPAENIKQLKTFIDELFIQLNTDTTSSRKVFAKLSLTNRKLLESLKIASNSFSMFSLIKYLFKDDYGFNRPLISKSKDINVNSYSLVSNFANSLDSFNHRTIDNYINKMNIRVLYSYLLFIEDLSDSFVQINMDTMIKKEKMLITDDQLKDLKKMIDSFLNKFELIDTRCFNGYQMLPNIQYHWNKYLLVGIIRTYFSEDFEIEDTNSMYNLTDFIIRKINKDL